MMNTAVATVPNEKIAALDSVRGQPERTVITIRLPKKQWAKAWRAMIDVAPVRLIAPDPVYEVLPAHLELLTARGFTYEIVPPARQPEKRRHGTAD